MTNPKTAKKIFCKAAISVSLFLFPFYLVSAEEQPISRKPMPVVVNGDVLEFFSEEQKVIAEGNIQIDYDDIKLTCDRITVFMQTWDAFADGNVVLESPQGVLSCESLVYNFDSKQGKLVDADFKSDPYFGFSPEIEKEPAKFILNKGYITTCNLDKPHYRIHAHDIVVTPNEKIEAKHAVFFLGSVPLMYVPYFRQSLKDKRHYFNFTPGQSKEWGAFILSEYRYWLFDERIWGKLRFDWRQYKGFGGGIEVEHNLLGNGLLNYYQINEHLRGRGKVSPFHDSPRYKLEYRHKGQIGERKSFILELHRFSDIDFLKHYFYRQYERESQPASYLLLSQVFDRANLSLELRPRLNQFFSETEKIPEIKMETISQRMGDSNIFFKNESVFTSFTKRIADSAEDDDTVRFDTYNKLMYPFKFFYIEFVPFIAERFTYYSKGSEGDENLTRNIFYSGIEMSTKFYRVSDTSVDSFGLEIDQLRHVITPSITFNYINNPTLSSSRLVEFDSIDTISRHNTMKLSLQNKLQTKRDGSSVDFLNFIIDSTYDFQLEGYGGRFLDVNLDLEMSPNSWVGFRSDAVFDSIRRSFRDARFDISFEFDKKNRDALSVGYSYLRDSDSKLATFGFTKQINPKWRFRSYQRYNFVTNRMEEQEYGFVRDLHCWEMEFSINSRDKKGVTFWLAFKVKAFPDMGFDVKKGYHN